MDMLSTEAKGKAKGKAREASITTKDPSSRTSRLLAAYEASHVNNQTTYHEVPSSHFLARPNGVSSGHASDDSSSSGAPTVFYGSHSQVSGSHRQSGGHTKSQNSKSEIHLEHLDIKSDSTSSCNEHHSRNFLPTHPLFSLDSNITTPFVGGQQPRHHMPDTTTLAAADYDIDVRSGFLPPETPVARLEGIEEDIWENMLDVARQIPLRIGGGGIDVSDDDRKNARRWRRDIRKMLILHPSPQLISDIRYARRAHLVLSFLAHFYIHSQPDPTSAKLALKTKSWWLPSWRALSEDEQDEIDESTGKFRSTVPASIAIPWVAISRQIDLPPILTYATTVLWNWSTKDPAQGFEDENLVMNTTFSGTTSEEHFYRTSLLIEKRGVEALTWMRRTLDEAFVADLISLRRIRQYLRQLSKVIIDLRWLLHDVRTGCDPTTFYWGIRPWFNGCDGGTDPITGEKGWLYEGVEEYEGRRQMFLGPSAGQSSLIHAIDVFMGVDHTGRAVSASERENGTFMERMQTYMPGHHRNFLTHLRGISFVDDEADWREKKEQDLAEDAEDISVEQNEDAEDVREKHPIRSLFKFDDSSLTFSDDQVNRKKAINDLRDAYNETLMSLKNLRDEHMQIATYYIISQMRKSPPKEFSQLSDGLIKIASGGGAKGTGGTDLVSFLKDCRKNTISALHSDTSNR